MGIFVFIVTLLVLVLVHELGHFLVARWFGVAVEEFGFGFPPALFKRRWGNTTYSFNAIPLGGFVRIKGEEDAVAAPDSFSVLPAWRRASIIVAGIVMNLLVAVGLFTFGYGIGLPQEIGDELPPHAMVSQVEHHVASVLPKTPADGVLQPGDVIVSLDGQQFGTLPALQNYIRTHDAQPIQIDVEREGARQAIALTPTTLPDRSNTVGFGVQLFTTARVAYPWYWAPVAGLQLTGHLLQTIGMTFWDFGKSLLGGPKVAVDVAGPIGIAVITTQVVDLGWVFVVQFVALLSLNLAVVNLLPFPALDGGRLFFILLELIRRRPVSQEVEARFHRIGFAILLLIIVGVTYLDLQRFGGGFVSWLQGVREL